MLEAVSQRFADKPFAKLSPPEKDAVRAFASKLRPVEAQPAGSAVEPPTSPVDTSAVPVNAPAVSSAGAAPEATVIPFRNSEAPAEVYEGAARAAKVTKLADYMHSQGISAKDAANPDLMTDKMWTAIAKEAGVNAPSKASIAQTLFQLRKLETPAVSPAYLDRLQKTGALPIAEQLRALQQ